MSGWSNKRRTQLEHFSSGFWSHKQTSARRVNQYAPVPLCFRSSCQSGLKRITNSGNTALAAEVNELREVLQVRRRLVLACRHQEAVGTEKVVLSADLDVNVAFSADRFRPNRLLPGRNAAIFLDRRPRSRQRIVDGRDLVDDDVRVGLVGIEPLLDDGLVVLVQRKTGPVIGARALEITGFDF